MNLSRLFFVLAFVLALVSCNKDDDEATCTQADWIGNYIGTIDCNGTSEDVEVTITASGSEAIIIFYETATFTSLFSPLTPDGCNLSEASSVGGMPATIDATLGGDNLTLMDTKSVGGGSSCNLTATRQ